jgi:hypothetical protein
VKRRLDDEITYLIGRCRAANFMVALDKKSFALLAPLRRTSSLDLGVLRHIRPFDPSSRTWAQELFHVAVAEVDDAARRLSAIR